MDLHTRRAPPLPATSLPGYGLPLDTYEGRDNQGFKHPLLNHDGAGPVLPVREYTMMDFMNRVTDKVKWEEKVFDQGIVAKWKGESVHDEEDPANGFSEEMFKWCIMELRHKASEYQANQFVEALDSINKSDIIVPEDLRQCLITAVKPLEDIPDRYKDWHPGSDHLVLDLVHPSLYPLVFGQTKILPNDTVTRVDCLRRSGEGDVIPVPQEPANKHAWSTKFQWLPTEFENDKKTGTVRALSYINNLRPDHRSNLYNLIEQIVAKAMPLWSATLTAAKQRDDIQPRLQIKGNGYMDPPESPEPEYDAEDDTWNDRIQEWQDARKVIGPEPYLSSIEDRFAKIKNRKNNVNLESMRRLQIIVKLANIHLTPEKPDYSGGSWHVEGQPNEQICASALYYYDSENVSDSLLAFRKDISEDGEVGLPYEQDDHRALEEVYSFRNEIDVKLQEVGKVVTKPGRLLTFPNLLQHRVEPFELEDKSKPGHRKLLALFLVDPWKPIISTSHVPPQQETWWKPQIRGLGRLGDLPPELNQNIMDMVDTFPITMEKTKEQRLELMDERKYFMKRQEEEVWQQRTYFLCEH